MIKKYKDKYPQIGPGVYVDGSAQIIGDVIVDDQSSIWFNTVIRGDVNYIRIGKKTNIQDLCMLHVTKGTHPLIIGNEVTVGHSVTLHGCTIRDRCLIGMGATVLDGADVGEDSIVGAGSLVKEGMRVGPRTLVVGVPAKTVRSLTDEEVARIKKSSENYIEYMKDYKS